jgi:colicin import membrane protein
VVHLIVVAVVFGGVRLAAEPDLVEAVPVDLVPAETMKNVPAKSAEKKLEKLVLPTLSEQPDASSSSAESEGGAKPAESAKKLEKPELPKPSAQPAASPPPEEKGETPAADKPKSGGDASLTGDGTATAGRQAGDPQFSAQDIFAMMKATDGQSDSGGVAVSSLADKLPQGQIDAVRAQVQRCWKIPTGWTNPRKVSVAIRFHLKRDGTVDGTPVVTEGPASAIGKAAADNAVVAVKRCAPYQLPADSYDKWREIELHLAPGG